MRWILLSSICFSTQVAAADFRVADFGASCAGIGEREQALGSRPVAWGRPGPEFKGFKGEAFGREVSILYLCPKDVLCTGNYLFPWESFDEALKSLRSVYDDLATKYGSPFVDTTPWQPDADPRFVWPDPRGYRATWRAAGIGTTISVMPKDKSESAWQVFVVVSQVGP
jgi:hypothetical protein